MLEKVMRKQSQKIGLPVVFTLISFVPFGISLAILKKSGIDNQIALYWFLVGVAFLFFPYISELKFKDIEIKIKDAITTNLKDITKKLDEIAPRRFANLVYLISTRGKVALIERKFYKKLVPPGTRLGYHEEPHDAILRVLEEQLGLKDVKLDFWPPFSERTYKDKQDDGQVTLVPVPYQVQKEMRKHPEGIPEHYDFVYVCLVEEELKMHGNMNPDWYSLGQIKSREENSKYGITFPDIIPTLERLLPELEREGKISLTSGSR